MAEAALSPDARDLLQRRLLALNDGDLVLRDWDMTFVQSVYWRKPEDLTPRQREMVELLCWRYRAQLAHAVVPASEPKLSPKPERPDRSFQPGPRHRQRGITP
jgi:hypothetical protein